MRADLPPPLKSETNTDDMKERIEAAFHASDAYEKFKALGGVEEGFESFFEHGQWFVRVETDDDSHPTRTYSVVDAEPGIDGFDFEEL